MPYRPRPPDFKAGELVSVYGRLGRVIALADDAPMLLIRWHGSRICDWIKAEEAAHVDEAGDRARQKEIGA